ncbi:MAG: phosphoribosylaminoimidazolesuccinocarboxamide synthase [Chloroflexi bacterium]|nr:phosphoribosylaminoimidazolesuccinocarboxamide synthase [Chloroflexota bacterium]
MTTIMRTELSLSLFGCGKVRDTYDLGDKLLIIATDRISAFDVVLPSAIPEKGMVLNQLSCFWFEKTKNIVQNHLIKTVDTLDLLKDYVPSDTTLPNYLVGRSMITRKAKLVPVECVVRGYISGSAWDEYKARGTMNSMAMPKDLRESEKLAEPVFTPTTKAETGHDKPLTKQETENMVGKGLAKDLEEKSLALYKYASDYALERGIIIADTKFEFGFVNSELIVIDEMLTPDSSRFWDASQYAVGKSQPSFDKQPIRDWLTASGWNKQPPAPELPPDVISSTTHRYREAYERLTGKSLQYVPG